MDEISFDDFFKENNLDYMKSTFESNQFKTVRSLLEVTNDDLKEMGVLAMGQRKEFQAAIREIKDRKTQNAAVISRGENQKEDYVQPLMVPTDSEIESMMPSKTSTPVAKRKLDLTANCPSNDECTPVKAKKTESNQESPSSTWLSTPVNVEKILKAKNIKLYTEEEINKAYGIRRKKMVFMNKKLTELVRRCNVRACSKAVITGMAETAWDQFNAEDANIAVAEVDVLLERLREHGKTFSDKQIKTIRRLTERLNLAKHTIKCSLKKIIELKETDNKNSAITLEENELASKHCELQKATDALRKACDMKTKEMKKLLDVTTEENLANENMDVSNDSIIDNILNEHDYA